jgi:hypothetical protein
MEITVEKRKFSVLSKYDISAPDCKHHAVGSHWPFSSRFRLLAADHQQTLAMIRSRLSFFRARYDFLFPGGPVYRFWCEDLWKGVYAC